jgi:hypothetical protein
MGILDRLFGKKKPLSKARKYLQSHPPRCLAGFRTGPAEQAASGNDGEGQDLDTTFRVSCTCGGESASIYGYRWENTEHPGRPAVFVGPIDLVCDTCGRKELLFDGSLHGYNAECGLKSDSASNEGQRTKFVCPECGDASFEVVAKFENPEDHFDEDPPEEVRGREQDFFTWFFLHGRCRKCHAQVDVADFECA